MVLPAQPAGALEAATVHYRAFPRAAWGVALLRARQLGATIIVAPVSLAHHTAADGELDLAGTTLPERDLLGLVKECDRLQLALVLALELLASPELGRTPTHWAATVAAALGPCYAPHGPIVGLHAPPAHADALRASGWQHPLGSLAALPPDLPPALTAAVFPHLSARSTPAGPPLLRTDGSVRAEFWRARCIRALLATPDFAAATAPADLALLADSSLAADPAMADLAAQLREAGATFHMVDIATTEPKQLAAYPLLIAPAALAERLAAQQLLVPNGNAVLAGPPSPAAEAAAFLPWPLAAEQVFEEVEARGGRARYAWADVPGVAIRMLAGSAFTYLFVENRRSLPYNGTLAYRADDGSVLHAHVALGAERGGVIIMHGDDLIGAAVEGDGAEGGWLVRGMFTSVVFSHGAAGIIDCEGTLLAIAPQSSRFQLRAKHSWPDLAAFRLLLNGALLAAPLSIEGKHLALPYIAEDALGQTDCYLVGSASAPLPARIRAYLASMIQARSSALCAAAELARLHGLALGLEDALAKPATPPATIDDYSRARAALDAEAAPALAALDAAHPGIGPEAARALAQIAALLGE